MSIERTAAAQLTEWLTRSGLQQIDFARLVSLDPTTLNKILRGVRRPAYETAAKIERETGVRAVAWLPKRLGKSKAKALRMGKRMRIGGAPSHHLTR